MQPISNPTRKPSQYHFCIRITPKSLSKLLFESKGIESLYKLQINKGSKRQAYQVMRRNLHQQAMQGFYRSQKCYFTLANYTNLRPYEMKITFAEINGMNQEEVIFVYNFSTYSIVKNFLQNGVRSSTHVVTIDYETEFYIDVYVQSDKAKLQEKVRSDGNKQMLKKRHFRESSKKKDKSKVVDESSMYSSVNGKSILSNYSASKSSQRAPSIQNQKANLSMTTPLRKVSNRLVIEEISQKRRKLFSPSYMQDSPRSERMGRSPSKDFELNENYFQSSNSLLLEQRQQSFEKKYPSTLLNYEDLEEKNGKQEAPKFFKTKNNSSPQLMNNRQFNTSKQFSSVTRQHNLQEAITQTNQPTVNNNQPIDQIYLQFIHEIKNLSLDRILMKLRKNIVIVLFVTLILFIVFSKAFGLADDKNDGVLRKREKQAKRKEKINQGFKKHIDNFEQGKKVKKNFIKGNKKGQIIQNSKKHKNDQNSSTDKKSLSRKGPIKYF